MAYEKVAQSVRQLEELPIFSIPWGHNIAIFTTPSKVRERESSCPSEVGRRLVFGHSRFEEVFLFDEIDRFAHPGEGVA